jgi:hypothetical protein
VKLLDKKVLKTWQKPEAPIPGYSYLSSHGVLSFFLAWVQKGGTYKVCLQKEENGQQKLYIISYSISGGGSTSHERSRDSTSSTDPVLDRDSNPTTLGSDFITDLVYHGRALTSQQGTHILQ